MREVGNGEGRDMEVRRRRRKEIVEAEGIRNQGTNNEDNVE